MSTPSTNNGDAVQSARREGKYSAFSYLFRRRMTREIGVAVALLQIGIRSQTEFSASETLTNGQITSCELGIMPLERTLCQIREHDMLWTAAIDQLEDTKRTAEHSNRKRYYREKLASLDDADDGSTNSSTALEKLSSDMEWLVDFYKSSVRRSLSISTAISIASRSRQSEEASLLSEDVERLMVTISQNVHDAFTVFQWAGNVASEIFDHRQYVTPSGRQESANRRVILQTCRDTIERAGNEWYDIIDSLPEPNRSYAYDTSEYFCNTLVTAEYIAPDAAHEPPMTLFYRIVDSNIRLLDAINSCTATSAWHELKSSPARLFVSSTGYTIDQTRAEIQEQADQRAAARVMAAREEAAGQAAAEAERAAHICTWLQDRARSEEERKRMRETRKISANPVPLITAVPSSTVPVLPASQSPTTLVTSDESLAVAIAPGQDCCDSAKGKEKEQTQSRTPSPSSDVRSYPTIFVSQSQYIRSVSPQSTHSIENSPSIPISPGDSVSSLQSNICAKPAMAECVGTFPANSSKETVSLSLSLPPFPHPITLAVERNETVNDSVYTEEKERPSLLNAKEQREEIGKMTQERDKREMEGTETEHSPSAEMIEGPREENIQENQEASPNQARDLSEQKTPFSVPGWFSRFTDMLPSGEISADRMKELMIRFFDQRKETETTRELSQQEIPSPLESASSPPQLPITDQTDSDHSSPPMIDPLRNLIDCQGKGEKDQISARDTRSRNTDNKSEETSRDESPPTIEGPKDPTRKSNPLSRQSLCELPQSADPLDKEVESFFQQQLDSSFPVERIAQESRVNEILSISVLSKDKEGQKGNSPSLSSRNASLDDSPPFPHSLTYPTRGTPDMRSSGKIEEAENNDTKKYEAEDCRGTEGSNATKLNSPQAVITRSSPLLTETVHSMEQKEEMELEVLRSKAEYPARTFPPSETLDIISDCITRSSHATVDIKELFFDLPLPDHPSKPNNDETTRETERRSEIRETETRGDEDPRGVEGSNAEGEITQLIDSILAFPALNIDPSEERSKAATPIVPQPQSETATQPLDGPVSAISHYLSSLSPSLPIITQIACDELSEETAKRSEISAVEDPRGMESSNAPTGCHLIDFRLPVQNKIETEQGTHSNGILTSVDTAIAVNPTLSSSLPCIIQSSGKWSAHPLTSFSTLGCTVNDTLLSVYGREKKERDNPLPGPQRKRGREMDRLRDQLKIPVDENRVFDRDKRHVSLSTEHHSDRPIPLSNSLHTDHSLLSSHHLTLRSDYHSPFEERIKEGEELSDGISLIRLSEELKEAKAICLFVNNLHSALPTSPMPLPQDQRTLLERLHQSLMKVHLSIDSTITQWEMVIGRMPRVAQRKGLAQFDHFFQLHLKLIDETGAHPIEEFLREIERCEKILSARLANLASKRQSDTEGLTNCERVKQQEVNDGKIVTPEMVKNNDERVEVHKSSSTLLPLMTSLLATSIPVLSDMSQLMTVIGGLPHLQNMHLTSVTTAHSIETSVPQLLPSWITQSFNIIAEVATFPLRGFSRLARTLKTQLVSDHSLTEKEERARQATQEGEIFLRDARGLSYHLMNTLAKFLPVTRLIPGNPFLGRANYSLPVAYLLITIYVSPPSSPEIENEVWELEDPPVSEGERRRYDEMISEMERTDDAIWAMLEKNEREREEQERKRRAAVKAHTKPLSHNKGAIETLSQPVTRFSHSSLCSQNSREVRTRSPSVKRRANHHALPQNKERSRREVPPEGDANSHG